MTNNNLTTEQKFFRFQDIVDQHISVLAQTDLTTNRITDSVLGLIIIELNSIIFTTLELTEINRKMINNYLMKKLKININNLKKLEEIYFLS